MASVAFSVIKLSTVYSMDFQACLRHRTAIGEVRNFLGEAAKEEYGVGMRTM